MKYKINLNFLVLAVTFCLMVSAAQAEIYGTDRNAGTLGVWNNDGILINSNLITGLGDPYGILVTDSYIYVANQTTNGDAPDGTVGQYNLDGTPVNTALITGLFNSSGLAISGGYLNVANTADGASSGTGSIGKYLLDGTPVDPNFITGLYGPTGIVVSGTSLFVGSQGIAAGINANVGSYNADTGATNNATLITGLAPTGFASAYGLALSGTNLLVTQLDTNNPTFSEVGEYAFDGTPVINPLISEQFANYGSGIAVLGSNIYLPSGNGYIGVYDVNSGSLQTSLNGINAYGLVVTPQSVPEPSTCALFALGGLALFALVVRQRHQKV